MAKKGPTFQGNIHSTRWGKDHMSENDMVVKKALMEKGINRTLYIQVANSPDVNLLDFGVFQSDPEFQ